MNREGKKCVLYPRVSTEMQVDGYSLEGQKNGLKRFADREEMEIVGIYEDAGKSGKSIEGRPAFKKMLSDIGNGLEIDYILVYKLSRFGRNAADVISSLQLILPEYQGLLKELGVDGEWEETGHCAVEYVDGEIPKAAKRKENRVFWVD